MKKTTTELLKMPRMGPTTDINTSSNSVGGIIELINFIGGLENKIMCEVGCFRGISTETFLQFNPKKLYAVDIWGLDESYKECDWIPGGINFNSIESSFREMAKNYENIEIIKNYSKYASFGFSNNSLDLVYIDGEHTFEGVVSDIKSWLPKIKTGGYISGHDISQPQIIEGIKKFFDVKNLTKFSDESWLIKIVK